MQVTIRIAYLEGNFNGGGPKNIVNCVASGNGIQVEQAWRFESTVGLRSSAQSLRFTGESCPQRLRGRVEIATPDDPREKTHVVKAALFKCRNS